MEYRLFIPSAGTGSRLGKLSIHLNKALVTVANKPVISHILDKIDKNVKVVIALGYQGKTIKDFLTLAYPDRNFIFVDIDKYEGPGTGLGYTMLKCEEHLQTPFVFCANDTIIEEKIPEPNCNWMGYSENENTKNYRTIQINNDSVSELCSKGALGDVKPYIGLTGIKDYKEFWEAMHSPEQEVVISTGESFGLRALIKKGIKAIRFNWYDTGNLDSLAKAKKLLQTETGPNILEKAGESIWFVDNKVLKFSIDNNFIKNRVLRAKFLTPYVPEITANTENIYVYKKVEGEIFSATPKLSNFIYLLDWLNSFLEKKSLDDIQKKEFIELCNKFYKIKTFERVKEYFKRFEQIDSEEIINGKKVPKLMDLLENLDWDWICNGIPVRWHGDLHFENILITENNNIPFALLDWRQDFGGKVVEYGDIYYELAKLNHGLIICHELIDKNLFRVDRKINKIDFDFLRKSDLIQCENYLIKFVKKQGYDYKKVQVMTYLIFLNIASLHHYPYSSLLFYLGKNGLYNTLNPDF